MQMQTYLKTVGVVLLLCASVESFAQRQSSKGTPAQTSPGVAQLSLEEQGCGMAFGPDGMLYILKCHHAGRYNKGTLSKLTPEAFSHLQRGKDGRNHALPEDLTEVYVFGRPGEPSGSFDPESIIAGADGKLYISGYWQHCARFDPKTQTLEWLKYGPEQNDPMTRNYQEPNYTLFNDTARCFAVAPDGMLWCKTGYEGSAGKVFHTRGGGKDLGGIVGTEQWNYAALAQDGYIYGATDDALVKVKTDGSDINVLHAFTGKNDHPVFAPILIGNTLFGCAHDEPRSGSGHAKGGYLYKLNTDGSGYSKVVDLAYDPERPLVPHGDSLYGMAPAGLFTLSVNQPAPKIIAPTKDPKDAQAMVIDNGAGYVLVNPNGIDSFIFRIPVPDAVGSRQQPVTTTTSSGSAAPMTADTTEVTNPSSPPPAPAAPVTGGKNVFHKRQSTDDSQGAEGASAGTSSNAADEGMSIQDTARFTAPSKQAAGSSIILGCSDARRCATAR